MLQVDQALDELCRSPVTNVLGNGIECRWDDHCGRTIPKIGGFGAKSPQLYLKRILACNVRCSISLPLKTVFIFFVLSGRGADTGMHTEIAFSSAVNLMRADSNGYAIWIGFFLSDLRYYYGEAAILAMMVRSTIHHPRPTRSPTPHVSCRFASYHVSFSYTHISE